MSTEMPAPETSAPKILAPEAALPKYNVTPYRPDGGYTAPGMMMLISALVLAGAVLGYATHRVAEYFYLIILFPALIGLALGKIGNCMVRQGRVRNPWIGGLAGFLGGALAMSMMHYFDYQAFRTEIDKLPPEFREVAELPANEWELALEPGISLEEREDTLLAIKAAGVKSMIDYMNFEAEQGVELKKGGSSSKGVNLGYYGSYIYWLIEIFIVAGITFAMVRTSAAQPYCAQCDQWKQTKILGSLGDDSAAAAAAVQSGDLGAIRMLNPSPVDGTLCLTLACCNGCVGQGPLDLKLEQITLDRKGNKQNKELSHTSYPPEALAPLAELFAAQPTTPRVPAT